MKKEIRIFIGSRGELTVEDLSPVELQMLNRIGLTSWNSRIGGRDILLPDIPDEAYGKALITPIQRNRKKAGRKQIFTARRRSIFKQAASCNLCGHECGGKRMEDGICPVDMPVRIHQHYVHLGEEKEIGKSLVIEVNGCNLSCRFCQRPMLIRPNKAEFAPSSDEIWKEVEREHETENVESISFLGGNPDQSFPGIMEILEKAPDWAAMLPVVWHSNGYSKQEFYALLKGIVDILVFDFKYFNDECAVRYSGAPRYREIATKALREIHRNEYFPLVIVRHLILPGHWECCQKPLIDWLKRQRINCLFNPMRHYKPLAREYLEDKEMNSPLPNDQAERMIEFTVKSGLRITTPNDDKLISGNALARKCRCSVVGISGRERPEH